MANGLISECYYCAEMWGRCNCKFQGECEHDGVSIVEPNVSECGRFFVNPHIYYGPEVVATVKLVEVKHEEK